MEDIPLSLVVDNPFNVRQDYDPVETRLLANSIKQNGLASSIKVRKKGGNFEIVYGHRRVRASRMLGFSTIRAEIVSLTDEEMLSLSLVENLARKDLSDYETALSFERMCKTFHKSYEEIGKISGYSKSHVANHFRMLQLFDKETLEKNPDLEKDLRQISERHSRVLLRIGDQSSRQSALKLIISENLSVRDLEAIVLKLRGWFGAKKNSVSVSPEPKITRGTSAVRIEQLSDRLAKETSEEQLDFKADGHQTDRIQIRNILSEILTVLPHQGNFEAFAHHHAFESGFSIYSFFPPLQRLEKREAIEKEQEWFYKMAPTHTKSIEDLRIQFYNEVALVTLTVNYKDKSGVERLDMMVRGTIVLVRRSSSWRIVHEHWSPMKGAEPELSEIR